MTTKVQATQVDDGEAKNAVRYVHAVRKGGDRPNDIKTDADVDASAGKRR
jgi:uncharacterized protein (DUF3084 family)